MNYERDLNQLGFSLYLGEGGGGGEWEGFLVRWLSLEFNESVILIFRLINFDVF